MAVQDESPVKKPKSFNRKPWTDMGNFHVERIVFQPDEAAYILKEWNTGNRTYSQNNQAPIDDALKSGRWKFNGETIVFGDDGRLLDGQHRLGACKSTGIALESLVAFGIVSSAFSTIDRGKKRGLGDDLSIAKEKHGRTLAAVLSLMWYDGDSKIVQVGRMQSPTLDVALKILAENPRVREFVDWASRHKEQCPVVPSVSAFCYYQFSQKDPAEADRFFEDLCTGACMRVGDPVLTLRDMLITKRGEEKTTKIREPIVRVIAHVRQAWNMRRKRVTRTVKAREFDWRAVGKQQEAFPPIV